MSVFAGQVTFTALPGAPYRKRRYLGRYFAHPMMQNRRAKRDDYKPSAVRVTQRYVP
ncbi:phosphatase [Piscirickettsiaceae bacterium NZ-RLO2]|nr:phosphatase [Piscirickettsiaceae bacterium NZ-RLO2]